MHVVAEAQRNGGICAYIDAEHAMDPVYASAIGVDIDQLLISQPDTGEQALEIVDMLVRSGAVDVVVIDSVAALTPRAEIEGEMGDTHVGLQARLMSQALRKLTPTSAAPTPSPSSSTSCERRSASCSLAGDDTRWPGTEVLFSVRLDIRRIESIKDGAEIVGNRTESRWSRTRSHAVPAGRVRHHVRQGHQPRGHSARHRGRHGHHQEVGCVVHVRGRATRPGSRERQELLSENPEIMVEVSEKVRVEAGLVQQDVPEFTPADEEPITID
jgi:recombination protein RecA